MGNGTEDREAGLVDPHHIPDSVWLNQAVQKLVKAGHRLGDIAEYTLDQFLIFLDAVEQLDAAFRQNFVSDMTAVVGGVFGGSKELKRHLGDLSALARGETNGRRK